MEQQPKHDDLQPLSLKKDNVPVDQQPLDLKKDNKDPKYQEDKHAPSAKLKRQNPIPLETIPENNEWHNFDQMTKRNMRKRHFFEKEGH